MSLKLAVGSSNFKEIIEEGYYFIDKSPFIQSVLDDPAKVLLFTRPRRFGKTLNLSMLYYFLEGFIETENKDLFDGLAISKNKALCERHQNQYPVIFLTFKDIKEDSHETAVARIKILFSQLFKSFKQLLYTSLAEEDKVIYDNFINRAVETVELKESLRYLSAWLFQKTGQKVVILIDEYDTPMTEAFLYDDYEEMVNLMRGILSALKDNAALAKGVLTGITRIAKESIFSDLNHLEIYSVMDPSFPQYFGFTEEEVEKLLKDDGHPEQQDSIKAWYNGYRFGGVTLYNPWSILNCVKRGYLFEPYWINTSSNKLIKTILGEAKGSVKALLVELLQGGIVEQRVDETLVFGELSVSEQALWNLMLSSGYVTVRSHQFFRGTRVCQLAIPNREVRGLYEKIIEYWFSTSNTKVGISNNSYDTFIQSLIDGNVEAFSYLLNCYLQETGSYFDFNRHSSEKIFHTFVLGLVVGLQDRYVIQSNKESGLGRFDVLLQPKDSRQAGIILEFKTTEDTAAMQTTAEKALDQIKEKGYFSMLKQQGCESALLLGVAFCGQQAFIAHESISLAAFG